LTTSFSLPCDPDITIRPATASDAGAIAHILRELGWFVHINEEPSTVTETRIGRHLGHCLADDSHAVLVAENRNRDVIGYVAVHWLPYLMLAGPEGYVSELFVCERDRGHGVGRQLLETVRKLAKQRGCVRLMLVNGRHRPSYDKGFYQKCGWRERPEMANVILPLLKEHL
jgi:GNAT superfamily N-acetyltransferase